MHEIKFEKAIVRIYGDYDQDKLKQATAEFLKKAEEQRRRRKNAKSSPYVGQTVR